jgi:hypothetical protein
MDLGPSFPGVCAMCEGLNVEDCVHADRHKERMDHVSNLLEMANTKSACRRPRARNSNGPRFAWRGGVQDCRNFRGSHYLDISLSVCTVGVLGSCPCACGPWMRFNTSFNTSDARQDDAALVKRSCGSIDAQTVANLFCKNHIVSPAYHPTRCSAFVLSSRVLEARPLDSTCRRVEKSCQPERDSKGPLTNGTRCVYVGSGVGSREPTLGGVNAVLSHD